MHSCEPCTGMLNPAKRYHNPRGVIEGVYSVVASTCHEQGRGAEHADPGSADFDGRIASSFISRGVCDDVFVKERLLTESDLAGAQRLRCHSSHRSALLRTFPELARRCEPMDAVTDDVMLIKLRVRTRWHNCQSN